MPRLVTNAFDGAPINLFGLDFTPIRLCHGKGTVYGFRFGGAAYLTDHSDIPPESMELLTGLDVLFLDALRHRPHPTHSTVEHSLQIGGKAGAKADILHAYLSRSFARAHRGHFAAARPPGLRRPRDSGWGRSMRIFRSLAELPGDFGPCAITVGNFDGVHIGHQQILRRVAGIAKEHGWKAAVLTFDPHPTKLVAPARAPHLLTTPEQRAGLMQDHGIDEVLILPFTPEIAGLTSEEFVREILSRKLQARAVLVGDNFRFGNRAAGDALALQELGRQYGFSTEIIHAIFWRGRIISSSEIRQSIEAGRISLACRMLGRPYALEGRVIPGAGIGSKQTVPTLNLEAKAEVLPKTGVYITRTHDLKSSREWPSITNVGYRPTFNGHGLTIETYLLSALEGDPPPEISVEFLRWVREERKFPSPEALKAQIFHDVSRAHAYFRRRASLRLAKPSNAG